VQSVCGVHGGPSVCTADRRIDEVVARSIDRNACPSSAGVSPVTLLGMSIAAIVGPGNIGTDLLAKLEHSSAIEVAYMVGVVESDGLARARRRGIDRLRRRCRLAAAPGPAARHRLRGHLGRSAHIANAPRYAEAGIQAVDLTPAHVGPMVCPPVNGAAHLDAAERLHDHLRRPGDHPDRARGLPGHAGALRGDRRVDRVALGRSRHPRQHRRVHPHHRQGRRQVGGADRGKAIIVLNPVDPPMIMRDTVFCADRPDADHDAIRASIHEMVDAVRSTCRLHDAAPNRSSTTRATTGAATAASRCSSRSRATATYLPPYAGNLDIMTAAAARIGELMARNSKEPRMNSPAPRRPQLAHDVRITDTTLRDGSHAMAHRFTEDQVRDTVRASTPPASR
jgi:acetaldehyde dehydrogenase